MLPSVVIFLELLPFNITQFGFALFVKKKKNNTKQKTTMQNPRKNTMYISKETRMSPFI